MTDSNEMPEPERRKIYDIEKEPDKDFWNEIKSKHELKHRDNSYLPDSLEEIRDSDRYEVEPLWSGETIQEVIRKEFRKMDKNGYGYPRDIEERLVEVFSSDDL